MISDPGAVRLALLVQYAMDCRVANPGNLAPPVDPRLAPDWELVGYITGRDSVFRLLGPICPGEVVFYGLVLRSTADREQYVAVIRGTYGLAEWAIDGECVPVPHPVAGTVEHGFFGLYETMRYAALGGASWSIAQGIAQAVAGRDSVSRLTVVGHSLGSALATYLTFDLAGIMGNRVSGLFFASPKPGNAVFGAAFDSRVKKYIVYNRANDIVPMVPNGPDYAQLPRVTVISAAEAQARIRIDLGCDHHILSYAADLDYAAADWATFPKIDQSCTGCILGAMEATA